MSDIFDLDREWEEPVPGVHGKCVEVIQDTYGDRYIYEDGYEEFFDIGD